MKNKIKKISLFLLISFLFLLASNSVSAEYTEENPPSGIYLVPTCVFGDNACTACDFLNIATNAASIILLCLSAGVLLMVVVGGFYLITSGGNEDRVSKGKKILTAAIVGTLIVAFSWVGVNAIIGILVGKNATEINNQVALFPDSDNATSWWQFPTCNVDPVADCANVAVGTPCNSCNDQGATGDKNCFCHIYETDGAKQELENGGACGDKCSCISLCQKIARDYASTYGAYECISNDTAGVSGVACLNGDFCPRKSGKDPTYKCCRPKFD